MLNKKGQLDMLQNLVISLVVIGIVLGIGMLVLGEFKDQISAQASEGENSTQALALNETINAIAKIPGWLSIIVILSIVGILLAIVFSVLPRQEEGTAQI